MDKCRLIIGAASGIGRSLLRLSLMHSKDKFLLIDRSFEDDFITEFSSFQSRFILLEEDITSETNWPDYFGSVSNVCSFAFVLPQCRSRDLEFSPLGFTSNFSKNISEMNFALLKCLDALHPRLSESANVVFISSVLATRVAVDDASLDYHVSKAALESIMRYLAVKLSPISVNCVAPGLIARDQTSKLLTDHQIVSRVKKAIPLGKASSQDEVAEVCWALCSGTLPYISGQSIIMDGGGMVLEPFGITGH